MGRPEKGLLRLSQEDQAPDTWREREQRRDHAHGQLLHHAAEHPECAASHLPRLQSRVAVSISRAVREARDPLPGRVTSKEPDLGLGSGFALKDSKAVSDRAGPK